ncbi:glycosyltransferase [Corynebacterium diphtheriae]|nr:glycosyltransferase [Corynebacterium diphtheriae]OMO46648.1 glycosyltransferase [Corynebacterium diphtheriae]RKW82663.1 glycosyltransferase family 1 protein [Corynebacterium diphtheriae]RKX05504.1 glycosyltransferase family 1 protein [Corynebacterium diphtheriae]RNF46336.1 glycosyltransferase family 1 protein [Corynebacterium diphtheriae]
MRILLLCWRDTTHPQGGGSERYLEHIAKYLVAAGHEVIFRTARHTDASRRAVRDGVEYQYAGGKYSVYVLAAVAQLMGRLGIGRLRGVDVVVDTQNGIPFFARVFSGVPTILLTHHCHRRQWDVAGPLVARLGWFIESKVSPWVHRGVRYVTVSEPSRDELVELGVPAGNITIVRNGIDDPPAPMNLPPVTRPHLVTLSRLVPHKQIEHAIDVVRGLDGVVLDIIGSGWWEPQLREYARDVADRVIFHGQVAEDHKHALLAQAAVHVMPSRKEGWGLAVIEAGQHGVPTVGYSHSGGLRDSVRGGGVLVETPAQLTCAIRQLLADQRYRDELGRRAYGFASTFSWEDTGREFLRVIAQPQIPAAAHSTKQPNPR